MDTNHLLNSEIARRDSLPPFMAALIPLPPAFIEHKNGLAIVCAWHGRTPDEQRAASREATDWATAHGWRVSHTCCPSCSARELAAIRSA